MMTESLNLNTLASSLPSGQQKAEAELTNNFRAAALSITTLYRSSRQASKRAHNAGYAAACRDLLTMIQHGVSTSGLGPSEGHALGGAMSIGKVMDWAEARLEEIKAREEEEDEDEEKERETEKDKRSGPTGAGAASATPAAGTRTLGGSRATQSSAAPSTKPKASPASLPATARQKDQQPNSLPTPQSPVSHPAHRLPQEPSSPSPPPVHPVTSLRPHHRGPLKQLRSKTRPELTSANNATPITTSIPPSLASTFSFRSDSTPASPHTPHPTNINTQTPHPPSVPPTLMTISESPPTLAGTKRRHAAMAATDSHTSFPFPLSAAHDSTGHHHHHQDSNQSLAVTAAVGGGHGTTSTRRRTRSAAKMLGRRDQNVNVVNVVNVGGNGHGHGGVTMADSVIMMDVVEEDDSGRERKRVARR